MSVRANKVQELLDRQGFVILDGGLATELEKHGANLDDPLWSGNVLLDSPELVEQVSYDYYMAGADVAVSASYQLTLPGLLAKGFTFSQAESALRESIAVVRRAAVRAQPKDVLVAASIGPYGAYLHDGSEYRGDYRLTRAEYKDFHRDRLSILSACEPDVIAFESIPNIAEAEALVELLEEFPMHSAWLSFTCRDGAHIADGSPFCDAVSAVAGSPQLLAVGLNCTAPRYVCDLLAEAAAVTSKPLVAYPNSGECFVASTGTWDSKATLSAIPEAVPDWYRRGARLIGGCCRTTPDTIRAIRAAFDHIAR